MHTADWPGRIACAAAAGRLYTLPSTWHGTCSSPKGRFRGGLPPATSYRLLNVLTAAAPVADIVQDLLVQCSRRWRDNLNAISGMVVAELCFCVCVGLCAQLRTWDQYPDAES